jgi:acyl dehydratase
MAPQTTSQPVVSLPDDLEDDAKEQLLELGRESEPQPVYFPIDELLIRHWCEALEDGNPIYLDEDYARSQGFEGLVAPPVLIFPATNVGFRWPWPPKSEVKLPVFAQVKSILNLPVGIATEGELEFFHPVQIGDRISTTSRLLSVSGWKKTRVGEGRFLVRATSFWNDREQKVAEQRATLYVYGRGADDEGSLELKGGYSNAIEEAIEGDKTPYQPAIGSLFWEEVSEGEELPEIRMPINMTRCVFMASATRDFSPQHSNPEYAKNRSKTKDVFVNTQFNMGMVSRLATDWAGPTAVVKRVKIRMKDNVCAGDEMIVTGKVVRKYIEGDEHKVDLVVTISNQDGPTTPAEATVVLKSRGETK